MRVKLAGFVSEDLHAEFASMQPECILFFKLVVEIPLADIFAIFLSFSKDCCTARLHQDFPA